MILYHWRFNNPLLDHTDPEDPWMAMRYYCKCRRQPWQSPLHAEAPGCQWIPQPATGILLSHRKNTKSWDGGVLHVLAKVWVCAKFQAYFWGNESSTRRKNHAPETCKCTIRKSVLMHLGFTFQKLRLLFSQQRKQSVIRLQCLQMPTTYEDSG